MLSWIYGFRDGFSLAWKTSLVYLFLGLGTTIIFAQEDAFEWGIEVGPNFSTLVGTSFGQEQLNSDYGWGFQVAGRTRVNFRGPVWWSPTLAYGHWRTSKAIPDAEGKFRFQELRLTLPVGVQLWRQVYIGAGPAGLVLSEGKAQTEIAGKAQSLPYRFLRNGDVGVWTEMAWESPRRWGISCSFYQGLVNLSEVIPLQLRLLKWELGVRKWF